MAKGVEKEQVEIVEKPKTGQEEAINRVLEQLEKKVEPPPISETLDKVAQAMEQANKAKHKPVKMTWYCTDCGAAHIQNAASSDYARELPDHINVDVVDDEFVDSSGNPLSGAALKLMENYATRKASKQLNNASTLAKMKELKGVKK